MSRQPMLLRVVSRVAIGMMGVATALLLAPAAAAQPDVDANNAITAAWQAGGGDTGPLGPRMGDVYPVGAGFAQNFAAGKMFFSTSAGAHFMQGAILEKYESVGGPADGDLGFPTIDEGPGRAPDSRNATFDAPDSPVIFWTPATGARIVRGPINAAWDRLGGSSGALGVPAEDETYDGAVVSQKFTGGELSYDARAKTFTTVPPELAGQLGDLAIPDDPTAAINAARRAAGGPLGPLGAAEGEPYDVGADGQAQDFVNGTIFYSPGTGANVVTGQVLAKYESVGGPEGDLGFPISSEEDGGLAPASRISAFAAEDKPVIFWTPDHGAVIVRGAMHAAWDKLGGATGDLGAPAADQSQNGDVVTQRFNGGSISWDAATHKFSTEPAGLAPQLVGLEVPGAEPPQAPPSAEPPQQAEDSGSTWNRWWLLAIVPILLVVGLVVFAVMRSRGRRENDAFAYEPAMVGAPPRDDDEREDMLFGDRFPTESLTSLGAPSAAPDDLPPAPVSFWGTPEPDEPGDTPPAGEDEQEDPDAVDTAPTRVLSTDEVAAGTIELDPEQEPPLDTEPEYSADEPADESPDEPLEEPVGDATEHTEDLTDEYPAPDQDLEAAPVAGYAAARDPVADTGRHARIDIDETPLGTALHMPFDDPHEVPDGYPIKADTRSGLYWTPESADFDEAPVEIWFASEEMARTNGFIRGE